MPFGKLGWFGRTGQNERGLVLTLLLFVLLVGCVEEQEDPSPTRVVAGDQITDRYSWRYRSFKVDVDLVVETVQDPNGCSTKATLEVDELASFSDRFRLPPTSCETLQLTAAGDIVLYTRETGIDWREEDLKVDTGSERVRIGPVTRQSDSGPILFQFVMAGPACDDDSDCRCGYIESRQGSEYERLALGRTCD